MTQHMYNPLADAYEATDIHAAGIRPGDFVELARGHTNCNKQTMSRHVATIPLVCVLRRFCHEYRASSWLQVCTLLSTDV